MPEHTDINRADHKGKKSPQQRLSREERLKQSLRANLKRRKAKVRALKEALMEKLEDAPGS